MAHKKRDGYAAKAKALRALGYKLNYGTRKATGKQAAARAQITRIYKRVAPYMLGKKQVFKFVKADTKEKRAAMDGLNPKVRTPKGFFVRIPKGAKKYRLKFAGGKLRIEAEGQRGGKRTEEIYRLNPAALAKNPEKEIARATAGKSNRKTVGVRLVVNGYDATKLERGMREFQKYMAAFFMQSQDPNAKRRGVGGYKGKKITPRQFADIFHVKLITQIPSHNGTKRKQPKRRR